jgi:S1-C subfamily serine protease
MTLFSTKSTKKTKKNGIHFFAVTVLMLVSMLFLQCATTGSTPAEPYPTIDSNDIRDYVCLVNNYLHPNVERYIDTLIKAFIEEGDEDSDDYARLLEYTKRGGTGSGFVYVDSRGNNYIITNYHVIVGSYRLGITFESEDGEKVVFKNLSILNVDESGDLAILAFPDGQRPFKKGIPLATARVRSGNRVAAAGYPGGIASVPTWALTFGEIANPNVTPEDEEYSYIQHAADINPGNSGGPLLIADESSPFKYSVVGVNTLTILNRPSANFAIPLERVQAFIQGSFTQTDERTALQNRITAFMGLLERAATSEFVYRDLSSLMSSTMINANPLQAVYDLPNGADTIIEKVKYDPAVGISWAVAYNQIESQTYNKAQRQLAQKGLPELLSVEPNNTGGYMSMLLVSGYPYRAEWVRDYGTWKLDDFIEDDGEYNDYYDLATPHPMGKKVIYSLSSARDYDWYTLEIPRAGRLTVRTEGNIDPEIDVYYDPSVRSNMERPIGSDDDYQGRGYNALVQADVRAGTVYIRVRSAGGVTLNENNREYILLAGLDGELDNIPDTALAATNDGPPITIVNNTGYPVKELYISPVTSNTWGGNRLASNQILGSGQSISLPLSYSLSQGNRYDFRLVDTDDDAYIQTDVQVTANGRIVFTFDDFVGQR